MSTVVIILFLMSLVSGILLNINIDEKEEKSSSDNQEDNDNKKGG